MEKQENQETQQHAPQAQGAFTYVYSSGQQQEIRAIREKYLPREESDLERLCRLDQSAARPGTIAAIAVGLAGTLLLGLGLCCVTVWADRLFVPGIAVGLAGLAGIAAAMPVYRIVTRKRREKLAPEILRLTERLLK